MSFLRTPDPAGASRSKRMMVALLAMVLALALAALLVAVLRPRETGRRRARFDPVKVEQEAYRDIYGARSGRVERIAPHRAAGRDSGSVADVDRGADRDAAVEVDHGGDRHAEAAVRDGAPDRPRLVAAADAGAVEDPCSWARSGQARLNNSYDHISQNFRRRARRGADRARRVSPRVELQDHPPQPVKANEQRSGCLWTLP
jgi:hypothetical protein